MNPGRVRTKARHQSRPSGWPSASRYRDAGPSQPQGLLPPGPSADCPAGVGEVRPCRCQRPTILSHAVWRNSVATAATRCIMGSPREVNHAFLWRRYFWHIRHHPASPAEAACPRVVGSGCRLPAMCLRDAPAALRAGEANDGGRWDVACYMLIQMLQ